MIIDEFCKHLDAENAGNLLEDITNLTSKVILAKRRILFFFSPATYNLPTKIGLVRFGYINKGMN